MRTKAKLIPMTTEQLIAEMQKIVDVVVEGWKTDFTEYDIKRIHDLETTCNEKKTFAWMARACGTWMIEISDSNTIGMDFLKRIREQYDFYMEYEVVFDGTGDKPTWTMKKTAVKKPKPSVFF